VAGLRRDPLGELMGRKRSPRPLAALRGWAPGEGDREERREEK